GPPPPADQTWSRPSAPRPVSRVRSPFATPSTPKESTSRSSYVVARSCGSRRRATNAVPSAVTPAQIPRCNAVTRPSTASLVQSIVLPPGQDGSRGSCASPPTPGKLHFRIPLGSPRDEPRLPAGPPAHRHRQGRHREVHGGRSA